jgi:hypothetical protein
MAERPEDVEIEITPELRAACARAGFAIVPIDPTDTVILSVRDDDGDPVFDGGVEHYFRSEEEAVWFGKQVWRGLLRAMDSGDADAISSQRGAGDEALHGRGQGGVRD